MKRREVCNCHERFLWPKRKASILGIRRELRDRGTEKFAIHLPPSPFRLLECTPSSHSADATRSRPRPIDADVERHVSRLAGVYAPPPDLYQSLNKLLHPRIPVTDQRVVVPLFQRP
jgi:hypothetical protein